MPITAFLPQAPVERVLVVGAAIGAHRERYYPFAEHMAHSGWGVVTFTYRGLGETSPLPEAPAATLVDWGREDLTHIIDWAEQHFPQATLYGVLHSISGELIGLASNHSKLSAAAAISTPRHLWSLWKGYYRYVVRVFFCLIIPFGVWCKGRLRLSKVTPLYDLPSDVALQWADVGLNEAPDTHGFQLAKKGFEQYRTPTLFVSFEDDRGIAPEATVEYLRTHFYQNAYTEHFHIRPEAVGAKKIGHSGFFDGQVGAQWWDELGQRLQAIAGTGHASR